MNVRYMEWKIFWLILAMVFCSDKTHAAFNSNLENSCILCHQELPNEKLSKVVELWADSVHAKVGNTCEGCHGGNPKEPTEKAMAKEFNFYSAPNEDEITEFCGKCHRELADNFKTSAHWATGTQNCIGCHGTHDIQTISPDIISEEKCSGCHEFSVADRLKRMLTSLHEQFQNSKNGLSNLDGFPTRSLEDRLDKIWTRLRFVRMISHTFDMDRIEKEAKKVEEMLEQSKSELKELHEKVTERRWLGVGSIVLFSLLAAITYFYNRTLNDS